MKTIYFLVCSILLLTGNFTSASAADNKVVVIPLTGGGSKVPVGCDEIEGLLTEYSNYFMSDENVVLSADGHCVVTTTGVIQQVDDTDDPSGPYFRTAQKEGASDPVFDNFYGMYALKVAGATFSTGLSATFSWPVTGGTAYRFGCAAIGRPEDWADNFFYCRVSWICSED